MKLENETNDILRLYIHIFLSKLIFFKIKHYYFSTALWMEELVLKFKSVYVRANWYRFIKYEMIDTSIVVLLQTVTIKFSSSTT